MRIRNLMIIGTMLCSMGMVAQPMAYYDATVRSGTYQPLEGGTPVELGVEGSAFDAVVYDKSGNPNTAPVTGEGFPIGFDFKYNNKQMNRFFIGGHGYVVLGRDAVSALAISNSFFVFSNGDENVIGFVYRSLVAAIPETQISYATTGEAPSRVLTVQFSNLQLSYDNWGELEVRDTVSLQIKLHETSGQVEMVTYGFEPSAAKASVLNYNDMFKIGILGSGNDRLLKSGDFVSDAYTTSDNSVTWRANQFPPDGTVYSFLPPEDCAAPAAQPTGLQLEVGSRSLSGSFVKSATADHYLTLLSQSETLAQLPADGTFYSAGDKIGDAIVLGYDTAATFSSGDILAENTTYHVHVLATNSFCFYGPKYNTASPLTAAVATRAAKPAAVAVTGRDTTSLTLSATGNAAGDNVLIGYTTVPKMNDWNQMIYGGTFGLPEGDMAVGDSINGGGYVAYYGPAADGIELKGLKPNTVYHLTAWSRAADGRYSSDTVSVSTTSAAVVPWPRAFQTWPSTTT